MRVVNRKARFDYEVIESYEAGIALTGGEVKSVKQGQINFGGSRAVIMEGEMWVVGMNIPRYIYAGGEGDPLRRRKLLLKKKELVAIGVKKRSAGLTLIPLAVYNKGNLIKVEVGLVRGKRKHEKREVLKKRTEVRQAREMLKK